MVPGTQFGQRAGFMRSDSRADRPTPGADESPAQCHPLPERNVNTVPGTEFVGTEFWLHGP